MTESRLPQTDEVLLGSLRADGVDGVVGASVRLKTSDRYVTGKSGTLI